MAPDLPTDGPPGGASGTARPPLAGRALIATPTIGDERFAQRVIFMLEHDADGALGVVLNSPGDTPLALALDGWAERAAAPAVMFSGGPVGTDRALGLVRLGPTWERAPRVLAEGEVWMGPAGVVEVPGTAATVGLVDLSRDPEELDEVAGAGEIRVFAGYAGWGAGQLDAELEVGAWWDAAVSDVDVFTADPDGLWQRVVARQGGTRSLFARFTGDPSLN